jgi:hypothetical protein
VDKARSSLDSPNDKAKSLCAEDRRTGLICGGVWICCGEGHHLEFSEADVAGSELLSLVGGTLLPF